MSVTLPVGTDLATLYRPDGTAGTAWSLDEIDSLGAPITSVNATLQPPNPVTVTVTNGEVVPLGFAFDIPSGGTVTFEYGAVDISITANNTTATSFAFSAAAALSVTTANIGNAQLVDRLPGAGMSVDGEISGR